MTRLEVIAMLQEYYTPKKPLSDIQVDIYLDTLDDIHPDLLELAAKHLIKTGHPFMPKVVELRKAVDVVRWNYVPKQPRLRDVPGAVQTWEGYYDRYGTDEKWERICERIASGDSLPDGWTLTFEGLELHPGNNGESDGDVLVYESEGAGELVAI